MEVVFPGSWAVSAQPLEEGVQEGFVPGQGEEVGLCEGELMQCLQVSV